MIAAPQMIYASRMKGTDIISYFHEVEIYHTAKPYIILQKQYIIENATFNDIIDLKEGAFMSENKLLAEIDV